MAAALVAAFMLGSATAAAADYVLGRGLTLLDDRLTIGGYLAVHATFLDETDDRLELEDLSALITLRITKDWLLFSEIELEDPVHVDGGGIGSGDHIFSLERLYTQWHGNDRFRLRVGQMLTPFGIWNVIHAEPLVWSTSRPVATEQFFDTGVTGFEASVFAPVGTTDLTVTAFGQGTGHIDDTNDIQEASRAVGARIEAATAAGPRIGASAVYFRDENDRRDETACGVDALWAMRLAELSAEAAINVPESGETTWGLYLQAVAHTPWRLHPFVRMEYVDLGSSDRVPVVIGIAWKPASAVVFKLEGIVGGHDTSLGGEGVLTSFSVLF